MYLQIPQGSNTILFFQSHRTNNISGTVPFQCIFRSHRTKYYIFNITWDLQSLSPQNLSPFFNFSGPSQNLEEPAKHSASTVLEYAGCNQKLEKKIGLHPNLLVHKRNIPLVGITNRKSGSTQTFSCIKLKIPSHHASYTGRIPLHHASYTGR